MGRDTIYRILVVVSVVAVTVVGYLQSGIDFLLSWRYAFILIGSIVAFVSPWFLAKK